MARILPRLKATPLLCLPPASGSLPEQGGIVVCSPATPISKNVEHAGHCYQQKLIQTYALNVSDDVSPVQSEQSALESDRVRRPDSSVAAKTLASKMAIGSDDLYELLELGHKRWHATADDIKKSFRRISLIYHPDKISHQGEEARRNSETHFKAVKKAYEVLSDKKKRAAYDSIDDVDDSLPSEKDATSSPARFYERFGNCFAINARWSVSNRVPELGDDETDIEIVHKFYDFWYSFKSWRDFSFDLEYDTDQAECREEKRWMERQNAKHVKSRKLEENARIRRLVDLAFKNDPRLKRIKEEKKAKKDAQKAEKRKKAEEQARLVREREEIERREAEKKAEEEKLQRQAAKKEREAARQRLRKSRQRLRAVSRAAGLMDSDRCLEAVERMCSKGNVESIDSVTQIVESIEKQGHDMQDRALRIIERALLSPLKAVPLTALDTNHELDSPGNGDMMNGSPESNQEDKVNCKSSEATLAKTSKPWTQDELSLLSKAVAKYPGGTVDRWSRIADFVGTRSADEVLRKVSENRLSKIRTNAPAGECRVSQQQSAFERFQEKKKGSQISPKGKPSSSTRVSQPPNKLHFTAKQQSMFETALKKHPGSDGEARWKKISATVGRTPEECKERFQELIAFYRSRKAST
ncbi:Chaperone J-domain containing protein [Gracilaria domingensis]|nr:Chaperone J-domain containing protein [Gracilaria domingensis]